LRKDCVAPDVSVVIPTYNRAEDLRRCLDSLVAQTYVNFEVVVCDDGSTDASERVAAEFLGRLDIRYETAENFGGPARPRNRGIGMARAPIVAFLDSDDWWAPEKLRLSVAALNEGADIVYHDLFVVRVQSQTIFKDRVVSSKPRASMFNALLCTGISIPNSSVVVRKELLEKIGGISEERDLISVEDYDTWIRLSQLTDKFVRIPAVLGYYWVGGGNISAASPRQIERIKVLYARHVNALAQHIRPIAEGFLAYRIGRIAQMCGDLQTARISLGKALRAPIGLPYRLKAILFLAKSVVARTSS
jgi:glycosyltransferase involved in cell wall biosynthesis